METTKTLVVHGGTLRYLKHDSTATGSGALHDTSAKPKAENMMARIANPS